MACDIISTRGALFVLWGVPTNEDMDRIVNSLRAAVEQTGERIMYVTRVPVDQPPPSAEVRRYLDGLMPAFVELVSGYHVVMEGAGFAAAVKRAVLLGLFQLTWRRKTFFVHSSVDEIRGSLEPKLRPAMQALLDLAKSRGLLDAAGPISTPSFARPQP